MCNRQRTGCGVDNQYNGSEEELSRRLMETIGCSQRRSEKLGLAFCRHVPPATLFFFCGPYLLRFGDNRLYVVVDMPSLAEVSMFRLMWFFGIYILLLTLIREFLVPG